MVDPIKYLETDEHEDFCVWINGNGDYILGHNFEETGQHTALWDASGFSTGVYFYTVKSGGYTKTMKMTLVK